jgi:tRNA 2-thiouridine synthesizing protein A
MAEAADIVATLDLRGLKCPLPVLKTRRKLSQMPAGSTIAVETTDPLAPIDIPHFCNEDGHRLVSQEKTASGHKFVIQKNAGRRVMRVEDFTDADIEAIENTKWPPEAALFNDEFEG